MRPIGFIAGGISFLIGVYACINAFETESGIIAFGCAAVALGTGMIFISFVLTSTLLGIARDLNNTPDGIYFVEKGFDLKDLEKFFECSTLSRIERPKDGKNIWVKTDEPLPDQFLVTRDELGVSIQPLALDEFVMMIAKSPT